MVEKFDHLQLRVWEGKLKHRPRRPPPGNPERNRQEHGAQLDEQAIEIVESFQQQLKTSAQPFDPRLIFKLRLQEQSSLSEADLAPSGLRMLSREPGNVIVVFPDDETLGEFRRRIHEYAGIVSDGHKYDFLTRIERIEDLSPEDRTGDRLAASPLDQGEKAKLDIELWHTGSFEECRNSVEQLREFLGGRDLRLTDNWIGDDLVLVRAEVDEDSLDVLLNSYAVREVERRPQPTFGMRDLYQLDVSEITVEFEAPEELVGVLVIDSGVMQGHPLLRSVIGDAQVFPDSMKKRITGGAEDGDTFTGGHGTAVAGIVAYGDLREGLSTGRFVPGAMLFSARVTDSNNEYDPDELLEHQLDSALTYFLESYPSIRVVNISLGNSNLPYSGTERQFRFAATIDELAYRHRHREVIFVISSGNARFEALSGEDILSEYPNYLLDNDAWRLTDPATSAVALTVGGLSGGPAEDHHGYHSDGTERLVAGERGYPSPFTRIGWGVDGSIKPDLVSHGGDLRFERGTVPSVAAYAGIPTTARDFAPPNSKLFRTVAGTSFSAPRVANMAAELFQAYPSASSNMVRALLASSAQVPSDRPGRLSAAELWSEENLRIYGYGEPDVERALWSRQHDVLLLDDSSITIGDIRIYEIPSLPPEFLSATGRGYLSATLAYDPPTRRTRADGYLGVAMETRMFRNVAPEEVADAMRQWEDSEQEVSGLDEIPTLSKLGNTVQLKPGLQIRSKGTLQKGTARVSSPNWKYNGEPLILAVTCRRRWAPTWITDQRFALVVAIAHDDPDVDLYTHIRQEAQIFQRERVRV